MPKTGEVQEQVYTMINVVDLEFVILSSMLHHL
jgi:hypothetical protein